MHKDVFKIGLDYAEILQFGLRQDTQQHLYVSIIQEMNTVSVLLDIRAAFDSLGIEHAPYGNASRTRLEQIAYVVTGDQGSFANNGSSAAMGLDLRKDMA